MVRRIILANPRGPCAGVDRAIQIVEEALKRYGSPVYVRKQIVHNTHVVDELTKRGAVFVESEEDIPRGAIAIFSAHGVAPVVRVNTARRDLVILDGTCPLVSKVHGEARRFGQAGYTVIMIGHAGHEEVIGTMGEIPGQVRLVECVADVDRLTDVNPDRLAYITQTTLSVDETRDIIEKLKMRFPKIVGPRESDLCYATTNRQTAVRQLAGECQLVLVVGSANSSNAKRLVGAAIKAGTPSHLVEDAEAVQLSWLVGVDTVGITSGASTPQNLVDELVQYFLRQRGCEVVEMPGVTENIQFGLPRILHEKLPAA